MKLTEDFYKKLHAGLENMYENMSDYDYGYVCEDKDVDVDLYVGDMYVTATVHFTTHLHDESFDHCFGTWHDPHPYLEVVGYDGLSDVHVYESDEKDAKEVEDFDYNAYWSQFDVESYHEYRKGMAVTCNGKDATFIAYNEHLGLCKVLLDDGRIEYSSSKRIKPKKAV